MSEKEEEKEEKRLKSTEGILIEGKTLKDWNLQQYENDGETNHVLEYGHLTIFIENIEIEEDGTIFLSVDGEIKIKSKEVGKKDVLSSFLKFKP